MRRFQLGEPFEIWGHWWLPGKPHDCLAGKLTSYLGNLELKLLGCFDGIDINARNFVVPVILGTGDAMEFTLWRAVQAHPSLKAPGTLEQTFTKMRVIAGGHFEAEANARFSAVLFEAPQIGPWLASPPVKNNIKISGREVSTSLDLSKSMFRQFNSEHNGSTYQFGSNVQTKSDPYISYRFDTCPVGIIEFPTPKSCTEAIDHVESLTELFTLLVGEDVEYQAIQLFIPGEKSPFPFLYEFRPPRESKLILDLEVLVPLPTLGDSFLSVLDKWNEQRSHLSDSVALLRDVLDHQRPASHIQIILLAQSLEAFHRNVIGGEYLSRDDYEPARKALEAAIPDFINRNHRDSLKARLKFGNELSLRTRLRELFEPMEDTAFAELGLTVRSFISDLVDARNDFTHWVLEREKERPKGAHLANLLSNARALTQLVLLRHLGINENLVVQRMNQSPWRHLRRYQPIEKTNSAP